MDTMPDARPATTQIISSAPGRPSVNMPSIAPATSTPAANSSMSAPCASRAKRSDLARQPTMNRPPSSTASSDQTAICEVMRRLYSAIRV